MGSFLPLIFFFRISKRGRVRPSVGPFVGPYVPWYFRMTNMAIFDGERSSNDIINNDTKSDDDAVSRYLFKKVPNPDS